MAGTFVAAVLCVAAAAAIAGVFSSTAAAPGESVGSAVVTRVQNQLVDINTVLGEGGMAAGTGMVLTANGEILTNNHVIQGATSIQATDVATGRNYDASVVGYDEQGDIAVLQLDGASALPTVTLGTSAGVDAGNRVVTIGNAGGVGGTPPAQAGVVLARDQAIQVEDDLDGAGESLSRLIEIRGDLQPGDSGGPMIDQSGRVVGMDTAASQSYQFSSADGLGFALEIDPVEQIMRQIVDRDAVTRTGTRRAGPDTGGLARSRRCAPRAPRGTGRRSRVAAAAGRPRRGPVDRAGPAAHQRRAAAARRRPGGGRTGPRRHLRRVRRGLAGGGRRPHAGARFWPA